MKKLNIKRLLNQEVILIFCIFLLGFVIRTYNLSEIPFGFHADEVDVGYVGKHLLLFGKDIYGNILPIYFDKFGDFRPTGIFYLSGLSTMIFGLNEFAVRLPSALFGSFTLIVIYFLALEFFHNKRIAFFSSIILLILPWHIVLSRATSEAIIGLFFMCLGLLFQLKGISSSKIKLLLLSFLFFLISYWFYHSFRLLIPLMIFPLIFLKDISPSIRKTIIISFAFFTFITIIIGLSPWGGGRFEQVAFYNNKDLLKKIDLLTHTEGEPSIFIARIFHNKIVIYGREFIIQYVTYFSPDYLFIRGGIPVRYVVPDQGLVYFMLLPLFLIGIFSLFIERKLVWKKSYVVYLLLISPIPAALTYEDIPNIHRAIFLILPLVLLASYGGSFLLSFFKKKTKLFLITILILFFFLLLEFLYFFHQYFVHTPAYVSFMRNDGSKEIAKIVVEKKDEYSRIVMPSLDDLPLYYLFYAQKFDSTLMKKFTKNNRITEIDNITLVEDGCPTNRMNEFNFKDKNILIITNGECESKSGYEEINLIKRRDYTKAFKLVVPIR